MFTVNHYDMHLQQSGLTDKNNHLHHQLSIYLIYDKHAIIIIIKLRENTQYICASMAHKKFKLIYLSSSYLFII